MPPRVTVVVAPGSERRAVSGLEPEGRHARSFLVPLGARTPDSSVSLSQWDSTGDSSEPNRTPDAPPLTGLIELMHAVWLSTPVVYHLLAQAGVTRAPWAVTTVVSCLPVLVLAMGTTLAHMLRADAGAQHPPSGPDHGRRPELGNLYGTAILASTANPRNQASIDRQPEPPRDIRSLPRASRPLDMRRLQPGNGNGTC